MAMAKTATPPPPPPPAAAAPRRAWPLRLVRWLLGTLAALMLALVLLLAGLLGWASSDGSLATALHWAQRWLPAEQTLDYEGAHGALLGSAQLDRLHWSSPALDVLAEDAQLRWQPRALLSRRLQVDALAARTLTLTPLAHDAPDEPAEPLQQLPLPLDIAVDALRVERITWAANSPVTIDGLAARYRYEEDQHRLDIDALALAQGSYQLHAQLQGSAPMALTATLQGQLTAPVPERSEPLTARLQAQLEGTLAGANARLQLQAHAQGDAPAGTPTDTAAGTPLQADIEADIAPWAAMPLHQASARLQALDLAALWPQAPATLLNGTARVQPTGDDGWQLQAELHNRAPGPWDSARLPLAALQARAQLAGTQWTLQQLDAELGGGRLQLQGSYDSDGGALDAQASLRGIAPDQLHTAVPLAAISGQASASGVPGKNLGFGARLQTAAGAPAHRALQLQAQGRWQGTQWLVEQLKLQALQVNASASALHIDLAEGAQQGSGKLDLQLPGLQAQLDGKLAPTQGQARVDAQWRDAAATQRWLAQLAKLPGMPADALAPLLAGQLSGNAHLEASASGGWQAWAQALQGRTQAGRATLQAQLDLPQLRWQAGDAPALAVQGSSVRLNGSLQQLELALDATLQQGRPGADPRARLQLQASGGALPSGAWQARLQQLQIDATPGSRLAGRADPGPWQLALQQPVAVALQGAPLKLDLGAGELRLNAPSSQPQDAPTLLRWQPLQLAQSRQGAALQLQTRGELLGLPLAWADAIHRDGQGLLAGLGVQSSLRLDGHWDVQLGSTVQATLQLARAGGDLQLQTDTDTPLDAGVQRAQLQLNAEGEQINARLQWDSASAGQVDAQASTRLSRNADGWQWSEDAPLNGQLQAQLPNVGVLSLLAPPGWRIQGSVQAKARITGTRAAPQWQGDIAADDLALRSLLDGVDLQRGRLRAQWQGERLMIQELRLHGGSASGAYIAGPSGNLTPSPQDGGTLTASGALAWGADGLSMDLRAQAQALQVLVRADRQMSVSGDLRAQLRQRQLTLRGALTTDRATLLLPEAGAPTLGDDVHVVRAGDADASERGARVQPALPPDIDLTLDLGRDFALQGSGLTTRLAGQLRIVSNAATQGQPQITGEITTVKGRYRAWGQMLDIEHGLIRFSGAYDNPALDILALRPQISMRAGVQVTGTARRPRVQLYSEPDLPDAEKLAWVVLGRSSSGDGAQAAVLQQAALALLSGGTDNSGAIAQRLGLDEIGIKGPGSDEGLDGAALTLGKRISSKLYISYEHSLSGAMGVLYIFYDLSRKLTLRGQTGEQSAVDLIFTLRYD